MRTQLLASALTLLAAVTTARAQVPANTASALPNATVDLRTVEGARLLGVKWRYADGRAVNAEFRAAGADLKASGPVIRTLDIEPKAGAAEFDDSSWPIISPTSLEARRGTGKLSFGWYRFAVVVPERVGNIETSGTTAVLEVVVDDYAEVWIDGRLPAVLGQSGGPLIAGWNAPNRIVLGRDLKPGQRINVAIFAANAPLSAPPSNYVWIRSATVDFYRDATLGIARPAESRIVRLDPALDQVIAAGATVEKLATGFIFTEGPVWHPDGYLLFSDPNANTIYRWSPDGNISIFRTKSGYAGVDVGEYHQPGSNGLTFDAEGRLTVAEHGRHRISRIEKNGTVTVLADQYRGKRLNSPNDLVYRSDGSLYFTDPPFGFPKVYDDPRKELPYSGVFRWHAGELQLLSTDLKGPNGIAFSPDEKFLYVANWDEQRKVVLRYEIRPDGALGTSTVFADLTMHAGEQALDGVKVDRNGNVYLSGPLGLWIFSAEGKALGRIELPELAANFAWGDADARTLYITARTSLYRVRVTTPGVGPQPAQQTARAGR